MQNYNFTGSEIRQILIWAEHAIEGGHFGDGNFMLPEEAITRRKMQEHTSGDINLTKMDLKIIRYWAEGTLGSSLKGMVPEEISVIEKLKSISQS